MVGTRWFVERIVDTGRMPLFCFFAGMVVGFLFIRMSVRLIRANVRWWPGNVASGGLHVHHMVFGVGFMIIGGVAGLAIPAGMFGWRAAAAAVFGVGAALVLDEFALILRLKDVYWSEEGRLSVDALVAVVAVTALLLLGLHPFFGFQPHEGTGDDDLHGAWRALPLILGLGLAVVTVLKGKIWTGLIGMFILLPLVFGAIRLARPRSPWARWRYQPNRRRGAKKQKRAERRERRWRHPVTRAKNAVEDFIAGRPG